MSFGIQRLDMGCEDEDAPMFRIKGMPPDTFAKASLAGLRGMPQVQHLFVCVADHFEPGWKSAAPELQSQRIQRWVAEYPCSVDGVVDSRSRPPQHTFFYPIECYDAALIEQLSGLVRGGYGDIEVHLHHHDDEADRLRGFLLASAEKLHGQHGLLTKDSLGRLRYGFIHGNWALDNSHPDGAWCGVNNEISILLETGCYADFTMPAAPHPAQTSTINSIYYAVDDPLRPKSHDRGTLATVHSRAPRQSLLLIQGPLLVTRPSSKKLLPKLENGNLAASQPPSAARLRQWLRTRVAVLGHSQWQFLKLYTHGAQEGNADVLLGPHMLNMHRGLRELATELGFKFYYVTAREMAQLVAQAEQGRADPDFDDLRFPDP